MAFRRSLTALVLALPLVSVNGALYSPNSMNYDCVVLIVDITKFQL